MMANLQSNPDILNKEDFRLFQQLILEECGVYFADDQKDALSLNITERIRKSKLSSFKEYYNFLTSYYPNGREELAALLDLITIGETNFFRVSAHFDVLREFILPEIISRKSSSFYKVLSDAAFYFDKPVIKIWSAGCSTGEEPYSLAICLLEAIPQAKYGAVSILATDVNRQRIHSAKEGFYKAKAVRNLGLEILDRYFIQAGDEYKIADSVKRVVRFRQHNLAKDKFNLESMQDLDVIFCRNVLIYFDLPTTKRIIANFYNCLNDDGYLIIGSAESLWQISDKFRPIEFPHVFVYKKQLAPTDEIEKPLINIPELNLESIELREEELEPTSSLMADQLLKDKEKEEETERSYQEGIRLFNEKQYDAALSIFDTIIKYSPKFTRAYFAKATIFSNQAQYKEAIEELGKIIKVDNLFIEAYYLMGVLLNRLGDLEKATDQFKKVIYIDSKVVLAHFNLGNIFYCQRKLEKAEREFKNAIDILEHRAKEEIVTFSEGVTTETLLAACKKNVEALRSK